MPAPLLVVPYTAEVNDHRFSTAPGIEWGAPVFRYLRDAFGMLYEEGAECPRMMQIGLHNRLVERPGRTGHLRRFVDCVAGHERGVMSRHRICAALDREFSTPTDVTSGRRIAEQPPIAGLHLGYNLL
ncbi:MAG: hypothetical protein ACI8PT_003071 [Gammaproteobacteria bacterium]